MDNLRLVSLLPSAENRTFEQIGYEGRLKKVREEAAVSVEMMRFVAAHIGHASVVLLDHNNRADQRVILARLLEDQADRMAKAAEL